MTAVVDDVVTALVEKTPALRGALVRHRGTVEGTNPSGDKQIVADRRLDELLYKALGDVDGVGAYASEERQAVADVGAGVSVATDPLDGSSNLKSNTTVGTVVAVYDGDLPASGRDLLAGIVLIFGPATTLTVAVDGEATEHVIEDGEIVGSAPVSLADERPIWGFAGGPDEWADDLEAFANDLYQRLKLRYTGAMVSDVQHLLARGGIAGYPSTTTRPDGVLRHQYEAAPVAYLVEAAGGAASTGQRPVLDVTPDDVHQRVPVFFGSTSLIEELEDRIGERSD
jgi:fructose-1,6-bisphosphatase I